MKSKSLVHLEHDGRGNLTDLFADSLDSHAPNLLRLSLRILLETRKRRG